MPIMKKRVLVFLLCFCLLAGILPAAARAEGDFRFYAEGGPNDVPLNGTVNYSDTIYYGNARCVILCGFSNDEEIADAVAKRDGTVTQSFADATAIGRGMFIQLGENPGKGNSFEIKVSGLPNGASDVVITVLGDDGADPSAPVDGGDDDELYSLDAENDNGNWVMMDNGPGPGLNTYKSDNQDERVFYFCLGSFAPNGGSTGSAVSTELTSSDPQIVALTALDKSAGLWKLTLKAVGQAAITTEIDGTTYSYPVSVMEEGGGQPQQPEFAYYVSEGPDAEALGDCIAWSDLPKNNANLNVTNQPHLLLLGFSSENEASRVGVYYRIDNDTEMALTVHSFSGTPRGCGLIVELTDPGKGSYTITAKPLPNPISITITGSDDGGEDQPGDDDEWNNGGNDVTVTVGETDYTVTFGAVSNKDGVIEIYGIYPDESFDTDPKNTRYRGSNPFTVFAGVLDSDSWKFTENGDDAPFTIRADKMTIQTVSGDDTCFSFSDQASTTVKEIVNDGTNFTTTHRVSETDFTKPNSVWTYYKTHAAAKVIISAEVTVTPKSGVMLEIDGQEYTEATTVTVSVRAEVKTTSRGEWDRSGIANDTAEAVNTFLADQAKELGSGSSHHELILAPETTYDELVIPAVFDTYNHDLRISGSENTVIRSIDLNGSNLGGVYGVTFRPDDGESIVDGSKALYGGSLNDMSGCLFERYDVAVDASDGAIHIKAYNEFRNNNIALRVDIAGIDSSETNYYFNIFRSNKIAVQVLSLNKNLKPYRFRISDSKFLCNETDFDIRYPGEYYMLRNYFYCVNDGGLRYGILKKDETNGTVTVHGLYGGSRYEDFEFIENETCTLRAVKSEDNTILDEEHENLLIAEQYLDSGVVLSLVDDSGSGGQLLAYWTFGEVAQ